MRFISQQLLAVFLLGLLSCCTTIANAPINVPLHGVPPPAAALPSRGDNGVAIGLAFSGGGTRAAAFAFGVLKQLAAQPAPGGTTLLGNVDFVSGVSGGSITAAYLGYRGDAALANFRERFLVQDVQGSLYTSPFDPRNILRAFAGGVNDRRGLQAWLDAHLFDHQTLAALGGSDKPLVWINASDIFDNTPFVFDHEAFDAICSDLSRLPISEAVAASAAVPIAFAPIVLQSYPGECVYERPAWLTSALQPNSEASANLQSFAQALENYRDPNFMRYIKLLDGGLVDNYGLAGLTLRREEAAAPYAPLTAEQAVRLNRLLFVVVDAGQSTDDSWVKKASGPDGADLILAAISTSMNSSKRASYDLFAAEMNAWRDDLVRFRCGLSRAEVARFGGDSAHWNCRDIQFFIARVSFSLLDPPLADELSRLPTSLSLPAAQVDALIAGGGEALARAPAYRQFLKSLGGNGPRVSSVERAMPPA